MTHPLNGIRVLDLTRLLPGAVCTMMLVDLGADVIKVEDPNGGDYARWMPPMIADQSIFFRMNNRGKRSMILDLKQAQGQAVLRQIAPQVDVLIESFRPGVMQRLGADYETLKAINPRLIYCAMSGWGAWGPYAADGGHDLNYATVAGLTGAMQTPQPLGGQIADIGGAYAALTGISAALFRRERTGEGAFIDIGLTEAALPFMLYNWVESISTGARGGEGGLTGGLACYRQYVSADGQTVMIAALETKFWANFCTAINRPDLIADHDQPDRQSLLRRTLTEIFAARTADEWAALLAGVDCCFSVVRPPERLADDPHFQARGMLGIFPDGTPWMRSPIHISDSQPTPKNEVPAYGQHTREILVEFGYGEVEIEQLIHAGTIKVV